jgi:predicted nucleic acid-binding protein
MIIAAAIQADCQRLYSEDLQHKQVIDKKLQIVNPFI